jgi:hypothetical protein
LPLPASCCRIFPTSVSSGSTHLPASSAYGEATTPEEEEEEGNKESQREEMGWERVSE